MQFRANEFINNPDRFLRRGGNVVGEVANCVEIEQVLQRFDGRHNSSFLQVNLKSFEHAVCHNYMIVTDTRVDTTTMEPISIVATKVACRTF